MRAEGQFISEYQKSFTNLGNRDYIFQRTSDGLVTDAKFFDMLPQVKTVENRGAVHNFRPDKGWGEQANKFLELSSGKGFKVLCGDYESGTLDEQAAIDFWCFLRFLENRRPNKKVIFYTTIYKLRDNMMKYQGIMTHYGLIDWEHFDLWLAQYPVIKNPDGTTRLIDSFDLQTHEPYLSIDGVVVRTKPERFLQYWADGNQMGAKFGCGSRDTNLDMFDGTVKECDGYFNIVNDTPEEFEERLSTVENDIVNMDVVVQSNAVDIEELKLGDTATIIVLNYMQEDIDSLESQVKALGLGMEELYKRLEITEETIVGVNGVYERIEALEAVVEYNYNQQVLDANNLEDRIEELENKTSADDDAYNMVLDGWKEMSDRIHDLELAIHPECNHSHGSIFSWLFNRR